MVKVSELTGPALNWLVARALGKRPSLFIFQRDGALSKEHNYSTDWAQGGPIIERECLMIFKRTQKNIAPDEVWQAVCGHAAGIRHQGKRGKSPLIAAMRCYVASQLGDEVEIPQELM